MQRDLLRLGHMLDAGEAIVRGVDGVTAGELASNDDLLEALLWRFTKLGEAAYQISGELKRKYPDVEWEGAMANAKSRRPRLLRHRRRGHPSRGHDQCSEARRTGPSHPAL